MNKSSHGFTLIEMMITLAVFALLIMIGLPGMTTWLQNTQIRTSAETMQMGLQFARAEALRRNVPVRFQLVDSLNAGCALSDTGSSWVVNLGNLDVAGACDQAESEDVDRRILQKRSGAEGTSNATVVARGVGGIAAKYVVFNGLGRVSPGFAIDPIAQIDIRNPAGGGCMDEANPRMRCLRLTVSNGGEVRMCDPAVDPAIYVNDPRLC
jgi:type IV fimbrial biogenesis protein FimT